MSRERGKKIDVIDVVTKVRRHQFPLRFDRERGDFFSSFAGVEHSSKDLGELKEKLRVAVEQTEDKPFRRVITITYSSQEGSTRVTGRSFYRGGTPEHVSDVSGFALSFAAGEVAGPFPAPEDKWGRAREVWLVKDVGEREDGSLCEPGEAQSVFGFDDAHTVDFTEARWRALLEIRAGIQELHRRISGVLDGPSEVAAKFLDGAVVTLSLPAPAAPPEAPPRSRRKAR